MSANSKSEGQRTNVAPVPLFLLKLVDLLESADYNQYVQWSADGKSFTVLDQEHFSKYILPKYFKHNKFTSFVRQLNLYGFRKITPLSHGLLQHEEKVEFRHTFFIRGKTNMLHLIKRKISNSIAKQAEEIAAVLDEVTEIKDSQSEITQTLSDIKQENEDLWREVVSLRQKHAQQQKVVNQLIKFLVSVVQHHGMGRKRRLPLEWRDNDKNASTAKITKPTFNASTSSGSSDIPELDVTNSDQTPEDGPLITELLSTSTSPSVADVVDSQVRTILSSAESYDNEDNAFDISHLIGLDDTNNKSMPAAPSTQLVATNQAAFEPSIFLNIPASPAGGYIVSPHPISRSTYQPPVEPVPASAVATTPSNALQRTNSVHDLNTSVDNIQKNLQTIQERLSDNNEQYQLDYDLIQDLFNGQAVLPPQISEKNFDGLLPRTIPLSNENNQLVQYTGITDSNPLLDLQDNTDGEKEAVLDDLAALLE